VSTASRRSFASRLRERRAVTREGGDGDGEGFRRAVASIEEARDRAIGIERLFIAFKRLHAIGATRGLSRSAM